MEARGLNAAALKGNDWHKLAIIVLCNATQRNAAVPSPAAPAQGDEKQETPTAHRCSCCHHLCCCTHAALRARAPTRAPPSPRRCCHPRLQAAPVAGRVTPLSAITLMLHSCRASFANFITKLALPREPDSSCSSVALTYTRSRVSAPADSLTCGQAQGGRCRAAAAVACSEQHTHPVQQQLLLFGTGACTC